MHRPVNQVVLKETVRSHSRLLMATAQRVQRNLADSSRDLITNQCVAHDEIEANVKIDLLLSFVEIMSVVRLLNKCS